MAEMMIVQSGRMLICCVGIESYIRTPMAAKLGWPFQTASIWSPSGRLALRSILTKNPDSTSEC